MRKFVPLPLVFILIVTTVIYAPSLWNGFVNLDDPLLLTQNTHVLTPSFASIWYVLTHFDPELYIPVTFLSYQLETWTLGLHAWHFHLFSLLVHLGSICLLYGIVKRFTASEVIAIATSALFALHPINAEAVLWVSARKDLLASFFALATICSFLQWNDEQKKWWYILSLLCFVLALGSKVSVITLPLLLPFLLQKNSSKKICLQTILPFLFLSLLFGVTAIVGKSFVGSLLNPIDMIIMAFRSAFFYLTLIVLPSGFAAVHSLAPVNALRSPLLPVSIVVVLGIVWSAWSARKRYPYLLLGVCFFLVMIAPSFTHYTRGNEMFMLGSERYVYLASVGIFFAIASLWSDIFSSPTCTARIKKILLSGSILFLAILSYLTFLRVPVFQDAIIFNIDIIQKNPRDSRAHFNLGAALEEAKRPQEAEKAYSISLELEPNYLQSIIALGSLFFHEGRMDEARELFQHAINIRPDSFKGYFFLGLVEEHQDRFEIALKLFRDAESKFPDFPEVHLRIANVLGKLKRFDEAILEFQTLATLDPTFAKNMETILREYKKP